MYFTGLDFTGAAAFYVIGGGNGGIDVSRRAAAGKEQFHGQSLSGLDCRDMFSSTPTWPSSIISEVPP